MAFLVLLHPDIQLVDGGDEDEQREDYGHQHMEVVAKDLGHGDVGILIGARQDVSRRIVGPVIDNTWNDAARTLVHPAQKDADEQGMEELCGVHVGQGKE